MNTTTATRRSHVATTIALCFLVALLEGVDLQSAGIAAQGMLKSLALDKAHLGMVFSAGILGLLPGAFIGGRLADRIGRKRVLVASVILFGLFSLATTLAWNFQSLLIARLLTGCGLGGAMPNLIALCSENAGERRRRMAVAMMYCGMPFGAALAALVGILGFSGDWRAVFYVGGFTPLVVAPIVALYLPESVQFRAQTAQPDNAAPRVWQGLFGRGVAATTGLLWVSYFFTLMVVYILINWLPSLLVSQGFSAHQAGWITFTLQTGAAIGTLILGSVTSRLPAWGSSTLIYLGILVSLAALGLANSFTAMLCAGALAGFFSTGGQGVLYALAPAFYPTGIRATGVGSALAIGRFGAMSGPMVAGQMLAMGAGTTGVLAAAAPGIVVAAMAMFWLSVRKPAA